MRAVTKMHSWAKLGKVDMFSKEVIKKQSWQSWQSSDMNLLFKAKLAKLR